MVSSSSIGHALLPAPKNPPSSVVGGWVEGRASGSATEKVNVKGAASKKTSIEKRGRPSAMVDTPEKTRSRHVNQSGGCSLPSGHPGALPVAETSTQTGPRRPCAPRPPCLHAARSAAHLHDLTHSRCTTIHYRLHTRHTHKLYTHDAASHCRLYSAARRRRPAGASNGTR